MTRLTSHERHRLTIFLLAFLLLQVVGAFFLVYKERHHLLADTNQHFNSDLALISLTTQSFLQNKNYSAIEHFMQHWLASHTQNTREIKIFKPTGETLFHYRSNIPVVTPLKRSSTIEYSLGGQALIELTYDLADIKGKLYWMYLWLFTAAVVTNILFWFMVRMALLRHREASTLNDRTSELQTAYRQLRDEMGKREQIQIDLQRSKARLEEAQRLASLGNWEWDRVNRTLLWSEEVFHIFARNPQEFSPTYEDFMAVIHAEDRPFVEQALQLATEADTPFSIDHRIVLPDGRERIVHAEGKSAKDAPDKPTRLVGTVQDITNLKLTEQELGNRIKLLSLNSELAYAFSRGKTLKESLHIVCLSLVMHLEAAFARIWLLDEETDTLVLQASAGLYTRLTGSFGRIAVNSRSKVGNIAQSRTAYHTNNILADPHIDTKWAREADLCSFAGHPLLIDGKLVGVMAFFAHKEVTESTIENLPSIADIIALGIKKYSAEEKLRLQAQIVDQTHDAIIATSREDTIISWNKGAEKLLGFTAEEAKGKPFHLLFPDEEYAFLQEDILPVLLQIGRNETEVLLQKKSGASFAAHLSLSRRRDQDGDFAGLICFALDISERKKAEEKMRLAAKFLDNTTEALLVTDAQGTIIEVNAAFEEMAGFSREEVIGRNPRLLKSDRHDSEFYKKMWGELLDQGHWEGEIWDRRKNGEVYPKWLSISAVKDERGKISHYVGISADISDIKQSQERLEHLAHYDQLTGLPNRLLFNDRLQQAIRSATRKGEVVAVLVLDLDRFKEVNDTLGHTAGDELLVKVAALLMDSVRSSDTVCRMGGDEFIIMLPAVGGVDNVMDIANTLVSGFGQPFALDGQEVYITPSIGISMFPDDSSSMETLVKNADTAMYHAKREGRNNFQFYQESMYSAVLARLTLKNKLRQALSKEEFQLFYQAKVDCITEEVVGAEALIRWIHPEDGFVNPGQFIPLAEETDLILPIGEWVIREACSQSLMLQKIGIAPMVISVNLSARQLHQQDLPKTIDSILRDTGLPAEYLEVEITESMLMQDVETTIKTLEAIKQKGVRISIDDFGTGYSSLNYLKRFPIDTLKVDRSFVMDITKHSDDRAVIASIIALAHNLNLKVVAEGVETKEELDFLKARGCDMIQGFYFSKPLPAHEFAAFLKERRK